MSPRSIQHPVDAAQQAPSAPDRDYGFFFPRWAMLAAILLVPTGIIGEVIKAYFDTHLCGFGSICTIDATPGPVQVLIIWAAFLGLWGIAFGLGHGPMAERVTDHTYGPAHPFTNFFWHMSHFERVTPFIYGFGGVAFLGMIIAGARGRLDPPVFAMGGVALTVAVVTLVWWLRLLNTAYSRPAPITVVAEPETAYADTHEALYASPPDIPMASAYSAPTPDYSAMPNYGDIPPSQYVPNTQPLISGASLLPAGLPSAPRLDSLEPPPNPNVDLSPYAPPAATVPLPPSPNHDGGGSSAPLPPQIGPLHPDVEAH